jgi:uncharacterized protein
VRAAPIARRCLRRGVSLVLQAGVTGYRLAIGPSIGPSCRYHPTCSAYSLEAIERHGPWRGSWLAILRVLRCHPLRPGGYDPVPREAPGGP